MRATFFSTLTSPKSIAESWGLLAGYESDSLQINQGPGGHALAAGSVNKDGSGGVLQMVRQPGRVDIHHVFPMKVEDAGTIDLVESLAASPALTDFGARLNRWFESAPDCSRIALGCTARLIVDSRETGYKTLQAYLPSVTLDAMGSSDFSYQINRPRKSRAVDFPLQINRLTKWGVVTLSFRANLPMEVAAVAPVQFASSRQMCRAELDLSTAEQNEKSLTSDVQRQLWNELTGLAVELLREGDRP